jgi:tRNA pseudouridine55 synthase
MPRPGDATDATVAGACSGRADGPPAVTGVLIVDKPIGVTSHDVVDVVRRRFREKAAGHLGTLDPGATGLLAVALGAATRCVPVWQGGEKTYEAVVRLGVATTTQDMSGEVVGEWPVTVTEADVRAAALELVGDIMQVPPMVSAVRVGGERLYRLARRGITVDRAARAVRVVTWEWLGFDLPLVTFRVRCSGGTYVRTLANDLGVRLGCGAALAALRRLASKPFDLARSVSLRDLNEQSREEAWARAGIPLDDALLVLPSLVLDAAESRTIGFGRPVQLDAARAAALPLGKGPRSVAFRDVRGHALALGEARPESGTELASARPNVVFPWAVCEGSPESA